MTIQKEYRENFIKNDGTDKGFAGEGFCEAKMIRVDALDHCDDDFHCFRVGSEEV